LNNEVRRDLEFDPLNALIVGKSRQKFKGIEIVRLKGKIKQVTALKFL
jgi:hypothetical protein